MIRLLIMMQRKENYSINIHVSSFQKKYEDEVVRSHLVTNEDVKQHIKTNILKLPDGISST